MVSCISTFFKPLNKYKINLGINRIDHREDERYDRSWRQTIWHLKPNILLNKIEQDQFQPYYSEIRAHI